MKVDHIKYYASVIKELLKGNVLARGVEDGARKIMRIEKSPNNIRFPRNILVPKTITYDDEERILYRANFDSLYDLYQYLKSNPKINREVFATLSSVNGRPSFAGVPYEEAVEELMKSPRSEYLDFLELSKQLNEEAIDYIDEYVSFRTYGGGSIDIPTYVTGNPLCFNSSRKVAVPKFVRINIGLSYNCTTSKQQVMNRAIITAALVGALERAGYTVSINAFELSREYNEFANINVNIKNGDDSLNKASLFKTLCYVEFLRRLLFRVLETMDVKEGWSHGYGSTCQESTVREVMKLDPNDIYIGEPDEMGIYGHDIMDDLKSCLDNLRLEDRIDMNTLEEDLIEDVRKLEKTIK